MEIPIEQRGAESRWTKIEERGWFPSRLFRPGSRPDADVNLWIPIALALLMTLGSYVVAYGGVMLLAHRVPESLFDMWHRWDAVHYIQIARDGYSTDPRSSS